MKKSSKEVVDLTVSAMYPDVKLDDKFMDAVILATLRPELKGLQPEGFVDGTVFSPERFHLRAVLEVCETAKRYSESWVGLTASQTLSTCSRWFGNCILALSR